MDYHIRQNTHTHTHYHTTVSSHFFHTTHPFILFLLLSSSSSYFPSLLVSSSSSPLHLPHPFPFLFLSPHPLLHPIFSPPPVLHFLFLRIRSHISRRNNQRMYGGNINENEGKRMGRLILAGFNHFQFHKRLGRQRGLLM